MRGYWLQGKASGKRMHSATVLSVLSTYGYPALGALVIIAASGVPVPIPVTSTFVVLGALTTLANGPSFLVLAVVGTLAAAIGHSADYYLGRSGNLLLRRWRGRLENRIGGETLDHVNRWLAQGSTLAILLTRFPLTQLASPASLGAGLARVTYKRFIVLELLGTTAYFAICLMLGRLLGPAMGSNLVVFALSSLLVTLLLLVPVLLLQRRMRHPSHP